MRLSDERGEGVLESEVIDEEVMDSNVQYLLLEFITYLPLVKGTSVENERGSVLERVMVFVLKNELFPVVNVVN